MITPDSSFIQFTEANFSSGRPAKPIVTHSRCQLPAEASPWPESARNRVVEGMKRSAYGRRSHWTPPKRNDS